ncbi:MAG: phosphodiester glycosidase family protein [Cyanobacteria bacterium]|nr:phosphodiester glycosidase family protein [Cyanobacteriota bacterium]MDW8201183.1 phosphodiester glycosidase family protein [Cyanobacteriota bacterium SKYGB_h_bin112]
MDKPWVWKVTMVTIVLMGTGVGIGLQALRQQSSSPSPPLSAQSPRPLLPPAEMRYRVDRLSNSTVHVLTIPKAYWQTQAVVPAVAASVTSLDQFAQQRGAIAVINGGFFDPETGKTASYVTINGLLVADPRQNDRLMHNPDVVPYQAKILNRSELRRYRCGSQIRYAIARHQDAIPATCQLQDALGAGPRLLPAIAAEAEGFWATVQGEVVRDPLGMNRRNARTAIGLTPDESMLWVMVAQLPSQPDNSGMTLPELAQYLRSLGAVEALNLDGGSSSSLYYQGNTIYGRVDETGQPTGRWVQSVLLIKPNPY